MTTSFHWIRQRMELLAKLVSVLSGTIHEWNTFISSDGDIGYLSGLEKCPANSAELRHLYHAGQSFRSIKHAFRELENDRQRLISLKKSSSIDFSTVSLSAAFHRLLIR